MALYHEEYGYLKGPYDQHGDDVVKISPGHCCTCGFEDTLGRSCTKSYKRVSDLRDHLRKRHCLNVSTSTAKRPKNQERKWAQDVLGSPPTITETSEESHPPPPEAQQGSRIQNPEVAVSTQTPRNTRFGSLLWLTVAVPTKQRIDHQSRASVHIILNPDAHGANTKPAWFRSNNMKCLQSQLGTSLAYIQDNNRVLHQSIVMAEILKHYHHHDVVYQSSPTQARNYMMANPEHPPRAVFLNLKDEPSAKDVDHVYAMLEPQLRSRDIIYPSQVEYHWDKQRQHDIRILEKIAKQSGAYRPRTCLGNLSAPDGSCSLQRGLKTVVKRSYSANSSHLFILEPDEHPACQTYKDKGFDFIHQEYVSSLIKYGEFRVFIVTEASESDKRVPKVVHTIRTKSITCPVENSADQQPAANRKSARTKRGLPANQDTQTYFYLQSVSPDHIISPNDVVSSDDDLSPDDDLSSYFSAPLHATRIHTFTLSTYSQLLAEQNPGLDSLKVGARLDIGVGPNTSLFVNEITRWYDADFLSKDALGSPYDAVCKAYARAWNELYPSVGQGRMDDGRGAG